MDIYTIWANKEGDISDIDWVNNMKKFFDHLVSEGKMVSYRITRCKMGFRSIADKHKSFTQFVAVDIQHALFRDWPDNINK